METTKIILTFRGTPKRVSGKVNNSIHAVSGVRESDNTFAFTVPKTPNGVYTFRLVVQEIGKPNYDTVRRVYTSLDLITDRTPEDVDKLRELIANMADKSVSAEEYVQFMKAKERGAYNYTDFLRVDKARDFVFHVLKSYGYSSKEYEYDENYTQLYPWKERADYPDRQYTQYITNLQALCSCVPLGNDAPPVPLSLDGLNTTIANNIEKLIGLVYTTLQLSTTDPPYCGELFSGEI